MPLAFTPIARLSVLVAASLVLAALVLGVAMDQRWLGLRLVVEPDLALNLPALDGLWIDAVVPDGPSAQVGDFRALVGIGTSLRRVAIEPGDLIEEPDVLASYAQMNAFFERQSAIAGIQDNIFITLETISHYGTPQFHEIRSVQQRPVTDLPFTFWLQMGVGLIGFWVGAWIWSLRPREWATRMLALAGTGLMLSAFPAAVYSTRELALPGTLFSLLSNLNHIGALTFGVGMIGLFMVYPHRLVRARWLAVPAIVLGAWQVVDIMQWADGPGLGFHLAVVLAMTAILILVGVQYAATKGDPRARAALGWFGISVVAGAGAFVATVIAPNLLGLAPLLSQGEAFVFFLLIYVGVALGVARYKLFALGEWAFRILFYMGGVLLLLVLDAILILTIFDDERAPAFALSLLLVAVLYLPLRDMLARRVLRRREPDHESLFRKVMDVALTPPGKDQRARWRTLVEETFTPLHIEPRQGPGAAAITEDGLGLEIPGAGGLPGFRLELGYEGRRLFSRRDEKLAAEISAMLQNALESRDAYEKGIAEERQRIARDIHDNIGVQLMGALHSKDQGRTKLMIRETLTDLRDIVNNASRPDMSFEEMLADLRLQVSEHLHAAGIGLDWRAESAGEAVLQLQAAHALRSIVREAVQNALKHAGASKIAVTVRLEADEISIGIADDGKGFDTETTRSGNGLANMEERVTGLGGRFEIESGAAGTRIEVNFPINTGRMRP